MDDDKMSHFNLHKKHWSDYDTVDVSVPGGFGRVANLDTTISMEHARWHHLRYRRAEDRAWLR